MLALALTLAACAKDGTPGGPAAVTGARPSEPTFDLTAEVPWPAEYTADPLWTRAAAGDDLDRARLARRESATTLLAALEHGGSLGRVALESLSYARDRRVARGGLCALLARANGPSVAPLLSALLDAVMDAPVTEESLDPAADARCAKIVQDVARREGASPFERDRAQVVLTRLPPP